LPVFKLHSPINNQSKQLKEIKRLITQYFIPRDVLFPLKLIA
jgi:hypothetical protein